MKRRKKRIKTWINILRELKHYNEHGIDSLIVRMITRNCGCVEFYLFKTIQKLSTIVFT